MNTRRDEILYQGSTMHAPLRGRRPFHQKSTCITELTFGRYVLQNWSRNPPQTGPNETLVLHRVVLRLLWQKVRGP